MTKLDPMFHLPVDTSRRLIGVFILECNRSNPNGDPNKHGLPRQDMFNHGIISNACLKRVIRDYAVTMEGKDIYMARDTDLGEQQWKHDANAEKLVKAYWDIRPFGGTLTQAQERVCGAVQFSDARSVMPIEIETFGGTRVGGYKKPDEAKTKAKKAKNPTLTEDVEDEMTMRATMFEYGIVPNALYIGGFTLDPFKAQQVKLSSEDMGVVYGGLIEGFEYSRSAHRTGMALRRLYVFESPTARGTEPSHVTRARVQVTPTTDNPASFNDYEITVNDNLPAGIKLYRWEDGVVETVAVAAK